MRDIIQVDYLKFGRNVIKKAHILQKPHSS